MRLISTATIKAVSTDHWRQDLKFFAEEIQRHHKNPFHLTSEEQFKSAVAALATRIPGLKDHEIVVGLQSLAAIIGDGHTFLATWDIHRLYPLDLYWFKGDLRVIRTVPAYKEVLGMRLVAIR